MQIGQLQNQHIQGNVLQNAEDNNQRKTFPAQIQPLILNDDYADIEKVPKQNEIAKCQTQNNAPLQIEQTVSGQKIQNTQHSLQNEESSFPKVHKIPQQGEPQQSTSNQRKIFEISFEDYAFSFQLMNSQFIVKGQKELQRGYFYQNFTYLAFTEQMKALFDNPQQIWQILKNGKQKLQFNGKQLYFKIQMGQKQKHINIPLRLIQHQDQVYIQALEKLSKKYINLSKNLKNQLKQQKSNCQCKFKDKSVNEKDFWSQDSQLTKNANQDNLVYTFKQWKQSSAQQNQQINGSQSSWFQQNSNYEKDHLLLFQQLIEKLNLMRDQFIGLVNQIQSLIHKKSSIKILRIKFLTLEKKKKDFLQELQKQRANFSDLICKNDIYQQIDQLQRLIKGEFQKLGKRINQFSDM